MKSAKLDPKTVEQDREAALDQKIETLATTPATRNSIRIQGARQNNLKNVSLEIPRDKLVVITGLSGSGKSSLAFDTLYAEGQRRYVESLSAYARQFLGQHDKPDVDQIDGLSPAVAIDQKSTSKNPRSTVGTVTEIYDYMRLMFARIGIPHDPKTGEPLIKQTIENMVDRVLGLKEGTRFLILSPIVRRRKGEYKKELEETLKEGYVRARINGEMIDLSEAIPTLDRYKMHTIEVVIDRLVMKPDMSRTRIVDGIEQALKRAKGLCTISIQASEGVKAQEILFSENFTTVDGTFNFEDIEPRLFSFNSPNGACPDCHGLGTKNEFDPELIVPDKSLSIPQGGIKYFVLKGGKEVMSEHRVGMFKAVAQRLKFDYDAPLSSLSEAQFEALLSGVKGKVTVEFKSKWGRVRTFDTDYIGVIPEMDAKFLETTSNYVKEDLEQYIAVKPCPVCKGKRLKPEALGVLVGGRNIADLCSLSLHKLAAHFESLVLSEREMMIGQQIVKEIRTRLKFLLDVGLNYLTLDRTAATLAGGEAQRIRLATQIGSGLMGVLYILDEPSIGLHQRDNTKLLKTLLHLRDLGNTVLVVEHDEETMEAADHLIDVGPGAGEHGGYIVAQGTPQQVKENPNSITGQYLIGARKIEVPKLRRVPGERWIELKGARAHNLQKVDIKIPLGCFVAVTGVSGSGKSTLIQETLYPVLMNKVYKTHSTWGAHDEVTGVEYIDKIIDINQSPIGRTPRSNPATYTGVFDLIRVLFSKTQDSKIRGYEPGRYSFNVKGGRCETCSGDGIIKIEMHFLPDVYVPCESCGGKRYNRETLEVRYKGKNISEVLNMTISEAVPFFESIPNIARKFKTLHDVGLDYIRLGQPATTLSGGEAQRVKLAAELAKRATGKTLYILDEPTTGLHFADVEKLIGVLQRLVTTGNSVLVIEHNLDVIKTADWLIDVGPEGGDGGGQIIGMGTPEEIAKIEKSHTGRYLKRVLK